MTLTVNYLDEIKKSRLKDEKVRDILISNRDFFLSKGDSVKRELFESPFLDVISRLNKESRLYLYELATNSAEPLLSLFNEYSDWVRIVGLVLESENTNFSRPNSQAAMEIAEAENPISTLFFHLRKLKKPTENQMASLLESAFPIATNGLDEETRRELFNYAFNRGVTPIEVANVYIELMDLITTVRFNNDE